MEWFNRTLLEELAHVLGDPFTVLPDLAFYNRERRHTTLGNLSPADYESAHALACWG